MDTIMRDQLKRLLDQDFCDYVKSNHSLLSDEQVNAMFDVWLEGQGLYELGGEYILIDQIEDLYEQYAISEIEDLYEQYATVNYEN